MGEAIIIRMEDGIVSAIFSNADVDVKIIDNDEPDYDMLAVETEGMEQIFAG